MKNTQSVRAENRKRIEMAIEELNYVPSNIARSLRQGKSMTVKAIMPPITLPFFAEIFEHLRVSLSSAGYHLILHTINPDEPFSPQDFLFTDGVIVAFPNDNEIIRQLNAILKTLEKPLVAMSGFSRVENVNSVSVDIGDGMSQAAMYLKSQGKKRIAYVGGDEHSSPSIERFSGFCSVIPPELRFGVYWRDYSMGWGYMSAKNMLDSEHIPDGVLCENDGIAAGVIKYMLTHGVTVPGDVWVIGFDNIPLSEMYTPSISSVSIPSKEMSLAAVKVLIEAIQKETQENVQFKATLVIRESSR
jgi:LacI family transcriptional regulator